MFVYIGCWQFNVMSSLDIQRYKIRSCCHLMDSYNVQPSSLAVVFCAARGGRSGAVREGESPTAWVSTFCSTCDIRVALILAVAAGGQYDSATESFTATLKYPEQ